MAAAPGAGAELKSEQRSREEINSFMEETKGGLTALESAIGPWALVGRSPASTSDRHTPERVLVPESSKMLGPVSLPLDPLLVICLVTAMRSQPFPGQCLSLPSLHLILPSPVFHQCLGRVGNNISLLFDCSVCVSHSTGFQAM